MHSAVKLKMDNLLTSVCRTICILPPPAGLPVLPSQLGKCWREAERGSTFALLASCVSFALAFFSFKKLFLKLFNLFPPIQARTKYFPQLVVALYILANWCIFPA